MVYDEAGRFQALCNKAEELCRSRGIVPLSEIDEMAEKEGFRGSAVIDELAVTEGINIDYERGVVVCR